MDLARLTCPEEAEQGVDGSGHRHIIARSVVDISQLREFRMKKKDIYLGQNELKPNAPLGCIYGCKGKHVA